VGVPRGGMRSIELAHAEKLLSELEQMIRSRSRKVAARP
jgi:hypothetical protein